VADKPVHKRDREHTTKHTPTKCEAEIRAKYASDAAAANARAYAWARSDPGTPYGSTEVIRKGKPCNSPKKV
jgi:hypothetical protein